MEEIHQKVISWFPVLREKILSSLEDSYKIKEKANFRDLVSEIDLATQDYIIGQIQKNWPGQEILGEESASHQVDLQADHLWVIDPIDGTSNMLKQGEDFAVMIAYFQKGKPMLSYIYNVYGDELIYAIAGQGAFLKDKKLEISQHRLDDSLIAVDWQRVKSKKLLDILSKHAFALRFLGSTSADSSRVLEGKFAASIVAQCGPWDRAPLYLFAQELDIKICQIDGQDSTLEGVQSYYFGSEEIYQELSQLMEG